MVKAQLSSVKVYSPSGTSELEKKICFFPTLVTSSIIGGFEYFFFLSCSILFGGYDFLDFADVDLLNFGLKSSLKLKSSKFTVNLVDSGTGNQWK